MKDYNNNYSPVEDKENFIWIAEYNKLDEYKRLYLPEIEFTNSGFGNVYHMFDKIDKNILSSLGLIGRGYKFYYDVKTGIFSIFNSKLRVSYYNYNNRIEYNFMNQSMKYNDMILYKQIGNDIDLKTGVSKSYTLEYGLGWKGLINAINIKCIFHLSMKKNTCPYFTFKLVSSKTIDGELRIYMDDKLSATIKSGLNANLGKTFTISIK